MAASIAAHTCGSQRIPDTIAAHSWNAGTYSSYHARPSSDIPLSSADTLDLVASVLDCGRHLDDEDPATDYALSVALEFMHAISRFVIELGLRPDIYGDGSGGLRLTWIYKARELRLVIPCSSDKARYLYWQEAKNYKAVPHFTLLTLEKRLGWLSGKLQS